MMSAGPATPAIKHYWFGKAYRDMLATIRSSLEMNFSSVAQYWQEAVESENPAVCFLFVAAAFSVLTFGMTVWVALVLIHVVIVSLVALFIVCGFLCVSLAEKCYVTFQGWTTICKHCGERIYRPEYQCSSCSRWHANLVPSSFGVLRHTCRCGQLLSCSFIGDRQNLRARCPHINCQKDIDASLDTRSSTSVICIIGPPSSGKTAFMIAAMQAISTYIAPRFLLKGRFSDTASAKFFQDEKRYITETGSTRKTINERPPAFNAVFESADGKYRQQVYFFDAAGEIFLTSDKLAGHHHFKHITGGIIIVDPFGLPGLKDRYSEKLKAAGLDSRITQEDLIDVVERFVIGMQRHFGLDPSKLIKSPYAVVLTKTDLGRLNQLLVPSVLANDQVALSNHIRKYVEKWGATSLTHFLDSKFENVQYFAASPITLRRKGEGFCAALKPGGLTMPLMWLLEKARDPLVKQSR